MNDTPNPAPRAHALDRLLGGLSALPVALITVLTFADVLGRYVFSSPLRGSFELIEYAMALVIFTALPLVTRSRGHVSVSLIDGLVRGTAKRFKLVLCDALSALALGLMTWRLWVQGTEDLEAGTSTTVLGLPQAPLSFALAAFAGISVLVVLMLIAATLRQAGEAA